MPIRRASLLLSLSSVVKRVSTVNSERLLLAEYTETGRKNRDEILRRVKEADEEKRFQAKWLRQ